MTTSESEADLDLDSLASLSDDDDDRREPVRTFLGEMCEECRGAELPAHHATSLGHLGCLKRVVGEKKEDIALFDEDGSTPLYLAARKGHSHCVRWLVTQDLVPTRAANVRGETAAMVAAAEGQLKCLKLILFNGYDHHFDIGFDRDSGGLTLLHAAVLRDREAVALWLVDQFGETLVEMKTNDGLLALHIAAAKGNLQLVKTLATSSNSSVRTQDVRGATPIFYSAQGGHVDCLSYMVEDMNGDVSISTNEEKSPLHVAVQGGHLETVQWLVGRMGPGSLGLQTKDGATVMHYAAAMGHTNIMRWLLSQRKSVEVAKMTDKEGGTAAHDAAAKGHMGCLKLLVELGLDIHQKDQDGVSPYQLAIQSGNDVCTQYVTSLQGEMLGQRGFWVRRQDKPTTSIDSGISCSTDDTASPFPTLNRSALSAERLPRTRSLISTASRSSDVRLPRTKRKSRRKSWKFWKSKKDDDSEQTLTADHKTIPTCGRAPTPPPIRSQWQDISLEARLLPRKDALFPHDQPDGPGYSWRRKGSKSLFQQKHRSAPVCLPAEEVVGKAGDKSTDEGLSLADRQIEMIVSDIRDSPRPESAVLRKRRDSNWTFRRKSSSEVEAPDDLVTALVNLGLEDHVSEGDSPSGSVRRDYGDKEQATPQIMRVTRAVVHSSDEDACAAAPEEETPNTLHDIDLSNQLIQVKDTEGVTVLSPAAESAHAPHVTVKKTLASRSYSDPTGTKRPTSIAGLCARTETAADNDDLITRTDKTWDFHFGKPYADTDATTTADGLDGIDIVQDVPAFNEVTNDVPSTQNVEETEPADNSAISRALEADTESKPLQSKEESADTSSGQEDSLSVNSKHVTKTSTEVDSFETPNRTLSTPTHRPRPAPNATTPTTPITSTTTRENPHFKSVIQQELERIRKPREITIVELDGKVVTCFTSLELETGGSGAQAKRRDTEVGRQAQLMVSHCGAG
ncbi:uncharacterized protein LOC118411459 [Branchiostoma floridae]|uniref:Uncharacterized protein LOC118411459 n=1 Tax=Branchiostoma floridae TaxID=7739 RepID=A0A9J7KT10_BRAFL|nr:uncharacterized protein LOC118411459 [Branchiostoma floridae]XP_035669627.1 uncharacterized protein LOC118411459 [Branchiostoma floridae]